MRAPHQIDLSISDALSALLDVLYCRETSEIQILSHGSCALISLSVRSAVDLYFQALALPKGSEVIVSAITHPDIGEILQVHGLVPVPVDLQFPSAAPSAAAIEAAASASTRAVIIAHLFGATVPLDDVAGICRERGWLLIEDCAQAFGTGYEGHLQSDAAFFSFGPLKTATALGGALTVIRDNKLFERMREIQRIYSRRPVADFVKRIWLYSFLRLLTRPYIYGVVYALLRRLKLDPSEVMRGLTKSFTGNFDIQRFRYQLSMPQMRMLKRRVTRLNIAAVQKRSMSGERLGSALGIQRFGAMGLNHTHWIFPVTVTEPDSALRALEREGIHAMRGLSNLALINSAASSGRGDLNVARFVLASSLLVPLPIHPDDDGHIQRIVRALSSALSRECFP